jgi:hypothetical protein
MALGRIDPEKLAEIEARAGDAWFISEVKPDIAELVAEVRRLWENAQKVADLIADAVDTGEDVSHHNIMVALRGAPYSEDDWDG